MRERRSWFTDTKKIKPMAYIHCRPAVVRETTAPLHPMKRLAIKFMRDVSKHHYARVERAIHKLAKRRRKSKRR